MHARVLTIFTAAATSTGCSEVCGTPDALNGRTFESFATVRTIDVLDGKDGAFPAESSPANGPVDIAFEWASPLPEGPVTVSFDGQPSESGSGEWSEVNCGTFTVSWGGTYTAEDGSTHVFSAAGYFVQYDDQLEGFLAWEEGWENPAGQQGRLEGDVLLRGAEREGE